MAKAKIVPTIVLELSEKEAEVLKSVLGNITGSGEIRDITHNIYLSLDDCGINALYDLFTDIFRIKERE